MKKAFLSVAALCLIAVTMVSCGGGSPKASAEKFLTSLYHMDFEGAKSVATEETKKQVDNYASMMSIGGEKGKTEAQKITVNVKDPVVNGDNATVEYTVSGAGNDDNIPHTLRLVKVKGKWLAEWSKNDMFGGMGTEGLDGMPTEGDNMLPDTTDMMAPPADGTMVDTTAAPSAY